MNCQLTGLPAMDPPLRTSSFTEPKLNEKTVPKQSNQSKKGSSPAMAMTMEPPLNTSSLTEPSSAALRIWTSSSCLRASAGDWRDQLVDHY